MFRIPGKEISPAVKEEEKKRNRQAVKQQFLMFAAVVIALKIGMLNFCKINLFWALRLY